MAKLFSYLLFAFALLCSFEYQANQQFIDGHAVYSKDLNDLDISFRFFNTDTPNDDLATFFDFIVTHSVFIDHIEFPERNRFQRYLLDEVPIRAPPVIKLV